MKHLLRKTTSDKWRKGHEYEEEEWNFVIRQQSGWRWQESVQIFNLVVSCSHSGIHHNWPWKEKGSMVVVSCNCDWQEVSSVIGVSTEAPTCNRALYIDTPRWPNTGSGTSPPPRLVPGRGQDQGQQALRLQIITSGGGHSWEPPAASRSPQVSRISETDLENSLLSMSETLSAKTSASTLSLSSNTSSAFRYFHPWQGGWGGYLYHTNKRNESLPKAYHLSRNFESALPPPPQGALQHGVPLLPPLVSIVPPDRVRVLLLQLERDSGIVHLWQQFESDVRKIEELWYLKSSSICKWSRSSRWDVKEDGAVQQFCLQIIMSSGLAGLL